MNRDGTSAKALYTLFEIVTTALLVPLSVLPLGELAATRPLELVLIAVILSLVCGIYIQVILHELGHLVFGLLSGYEFLMLRIGSLALVKIGGHIAVRHVNGQGSSGQCLMIPPEGDSHSTPFVLYNFGGALMNLLMALLCAPVYFFWPTIPGAIIYIFGILGVFIFLINWIPVKIGGVPNDGYNSLCCSRSGDARRAFFIILKIAGRLYEGIRLKDMDSSWFDIADDLGKDPLTAGLLCFLGSRYMDMGDMDNARITFERAVEEPGTDALNRNEALCELVYIASIDNDREKIRELCTKALKKYIRTATESASARRCAIACFLLCGKSIDGQSNFDALKADWRKCVDKYLSSGAIPLEEELMNVLERHYVCSHND